MRKKSLLVAALWVQSYLLYSNCRFLLLYFFINADVAQLVEQRFRKP